MKGPIVFARQRIGAVFGGAEGYVALLARACRALGADVRLMAQEIGDEIGREGFPIIRAPSRRMNVLSVYSFSRAVGRYKQEHPSDILVSFDRIPGVDFIRAGDGCHRAYLAAMGQTVRARFSIKHQVMLAMERRAYTSPTVKFIFANSNMVARDIRDLYRVPEEKLGILYTGLPSQPAQPRVSKEAARQKLGVDPAVRALLFGGHGFERKGLDVLIRALAPARESKWTLLAAGRGSISKHRRLAEELGLSGSVHFLGTVPLDDAFAAADLFVLPTRYDPLARVCLEAARRGLPVLTTRRNGFAEWIDDRGGYVASDPDDPAELAALLGRAAQDDLVSMGSHLRDRVSILTIEKNAEDMLRQIAEFT